jgi:predicted permease
LGCGKLCFKEKYVQNIAAYGLNFSNFAFMGLAVMPSIFPEMELEYTIFILPIWFFIYAWGAPVLLIGNNDKGEKLSPLKRLKSFVNPMMIGMLIGLVIGVMGFSKYIPKPISNVLSAGKNCMSPIAMLLTGITIAKIDLWELVKKWRIYLISFIKLIMYPLLFIAVFAFVPKGAFFSNTLLTCAFCVMCMPMGLNGIVIPAAYEKDTTDAAGMALITHLLSVVTIPLMFMLFGNLVL